MSGNSPTFTEKVETPEAPDPGKASGKEPKKVQKYSRTKGKNRKEPIKGEGNFLYSDAGKAFSEGAGADDEGKELLRYLWEVNGSEAYNSSMVAVAGNFSAHHFVLPEGVKTNFAAAPNVGTPVVAQKVVAKDVAAVFFANKAAAPRGVDEDLFGLLRMEAWKLGWLSEVAQVTKVTKPEDGAAMQALLAALKKHKEKLSAIRLAAWVVPLCSEVVFRTQGHHYLSGNSSEFQEKYQRLFAACLVSDLSNLAPPEVLYHAAFHWVGPGRIWDVVAAQVDTNAIPDAIKIRVNAAPAGSALVCSSAKVIAAMGDLSAELASATGVDMDLIAALDKKIRDDSRRYHKSAFVYGVDALSEEEKDELAEVAEVCRFLAPAFEGFIRAFYRQGDLGKVKVFSKHADADPVKTKKLVSFYKARSNEQGETLEEVFRPAAPHSP